jgi:ferredoxin
MVALLINDDCTACEACEPVCPNTAISAGDPVYVIDPEKCTECVGAKDEPQCKLVCPVDCIVRDPDWDETEKDLLAKYERLHLQS